VEEMKMEKFLWNLGGYAIVALSFLSILLLAARQNFWNALFCGICFFVGWVYMRKRPTWIEV
jgi:1,4-dihydroxy-2-naphthoate octaprenyltransferase